MQKENNKWQTTGGSVKPIKLNEVAFINKPNPNLSKKRGK